MPYTFRHKETKEPIRVKTDRDEFFIFTNEEEYPIWYVNTAEELEYAYASDLSYYMTDYACPSWHVLKDNYEPAEIIIKTKKIKLKNRKAIVPLFVNDVDENKIMCFVDSSQKFEIGDEVYRDVYKSEKLYQVVDVFEANAKQKKHFSCDDLTVVIIKEKGK